MAKKIYLLLCFWLMVLGTYGQDIITRTDGVEIRAQELEVKPGQVSFKLFQVPDTLVYQISIQDVQTIKMADGSIRTFNPPGAAQQKKSTPFNYETQFGKNILWVSPIDLFVTNLTFGYERFLASGKVSFKFPVFIGLAAGDPRSYNYNNYRTNTKFGAGIEVNFFPFGQGKLQYFFGPALHYKSYRTYYEDFSNPQQGRQEQNASLVIPAIKNGVYFQVNKFLMVAADVGLGFRIFNEPNRPEDYYVPSERNSGFIPGNLHFGLRF